MLLYHQNGVSLFTQRVVSESGLFNAASRASVDTAPEMLRGNRRGITQLEVGGCTPDVSF